MSTFFRWRAALLLFALLCPVVLLASPKQPALPNGSRSIVTSDGVKLFANIAGEGQPCVFIHGGPGAWSGMPEAIAGPNLHEQFQMVWYDQRGSGRSQNDPKHDYSMQRMVQDLEELRQQLGLESWVVMAHSFGGTIATEYAARYPQRIRGLVLLNCTLNLHDSMQNMLNYGLTNLSLTNKAPYLDQSKPVPERFGLMVQLFNEHNVWRKLQYQTDAGFDKVTEADKGNPGIGNEFGQYAMGISDYHKDFATLTAQIKAPVLVITGKTDYCVGPDHYKLFRFPQQQVVQMQTGHVPFVEEPEAFRKAVATWAKKLPRRA